MSRGRLITDWVWGFMNFLWIWMISMQRERGVIIASSNNNTAYNFKIIVIYLEIVILLSLSSKYWATAPSHWMTSLLIQSMHSPWMENICVCGCRWSEICNVPCKSSPFVYSQGTHGRWFLMRGTRHSHSNGNVWDISHIVHSIIRHYGMPFAGVQICRRAK